jgi:hypothetical protein
MQGQMYGKILDEQNFSEDKPECRFNISMQLYRANIGRKFL